MSEHVIAIDPGGTTGIATYDVNKAPSINTYAIPIDDVLSWIHKQQFRATPFTTIVIEPFRTAGRLSKYGLETIDLVGQLKGWAFCYGVKVVLYPPQSRRAWMENDEPTPHQQDAKAHLKHYLASNLKVRL